MRIFAVSDLHVDHRENREWLSQLSRQDYQDDLLIVAGDLTDISELLVQTFSQLRRCFSHVLYVPGNHELWVFRSGEKSSIKKFETVCYLAQESGISMSPWSRAGVTIVPLLGWYDYSFGEPGEYLRKSWMDYHACNWDELNGEPALVTRFFTKRNENYLELRNETIITFSHFLPRIDVMPEHIPEKFQRLYPILGSSIIEQQLRQLRSSIHIYGHSHVNREIELDGVTYINNAYGSPSERRIAEKGLKQIFDI